MNTHRRVQILKRKNFFPTFIITVLLWGLLASFIYFVDPRGFAAIPIFFILVFMALLFTISLIFVDRRRGFLGAIAITFFLILTLLGVGNILNFILILAITICVELYFAYK